MKKLALVLLLCMGTTLFAEELRQETYGENTLRVVETDGALLLEIVLPEDKIIYKNWMNVEHEATLLDEFDHWDVRVMLNLGAADDIVKKYNDFSDAAFEFGNDIESYITRSKENDFTVYSFEMFKSPYYFEFMVSNNFF